MEKVRFPSLVHIPIPTAAFSYMFTLSVYSLFYMKMQVCIFFQMDMQWFSEDAEAGWTGDITEYIMILGRKCCLRYSCLRYHFLHLGSTQNVYFWNKKIYFSTCILAYKILCTTALAASAHEPRYTIFITDRKGKVSIEVGRREEEKPFHLSTFLYYFWTKAFNNVHIWIL